jgi:hypothetical protein
MSATLCRRQAFKARQEAIQELQRQRESLRLLDLRIKEEQAFLRDEARASARTRAETEAEQRRRNFEKQVRTFWPAMAADTWPTAAHIQCRSLSHA